MVDSETIQRVAAQARAQLQSIPGPLCDDLEGCLAVVYAAGVAEALDWVTGMGPVPSGVAASPVLDRLP